MVRPLAEQVVVITGASSGIGRESALRLARRGARVAVAARREDSLDDLVSEIKQAGGEATSVPTDVSRFEEVEALAREARDTYGRIDTWVNNAGVLIVGEFENTDLEEARRLFDVNFWGEYHGCKAALAIMREQGHGTIINITSVTARRPLPLMSVYSASKAALNGLSEGLRTELEGSGIELCIIMPATIDTPLYENARTKEGLSPRPAPPIYPPSEVAQAIEMCAESPRRHMYAGPAGLAFSVSNILMPNLLDKVLGAVGRQVVLSPRPEPPRGTDNLDKSRDNGRDTPGGGWRGRRYMTADFASRAGLGLAALFLVRKLVKR